MRPLLSWIDNRIDNWIFHGFTLSPESLALYRICFAAYSLLFGIPSFVWIDANPDVFYDPPPSLAALFSGFPSYAILQAFSTFVCLLFILLLFGYKTRMVSVLLTLTLIVANSFTYSFGKIDHDIIPVVTPSVMSFSGWGACLSLDALQKRVHRDPAPSRNWPVALMALIVTFGFLSAGLPKALKWIDFDVSTHGVRSWVIAAFFTEARQDFLVPVFVRISDPYFWELLDIVAVAFELGFLVVLPFPKLFRLYIGLAVLFHFNNHLMLNIPFAEYMIVYLLFLNWEPLVAYVKNNHVLDRIGRLMRFDYLILFTIAYLPFYYASQTIAVGTSARTASPLQFFVGEGFGLDYKDLRGLIVVSGALTVVLYIALSKIGSLLKKYWNQPAESRDFRGG